MLNAVTPGLRSMSHTAHVVAFSNTLKRPAPDAGRIQLLCLPVTLNLPHIICAPEVDNGERTLEMIERVERGGRVKPQFSGDCA